MTTISGKPAITVALSQLTVSALNLRAGESADDRIDDVARTLAPGAAGQLLPLFVTSLDHGTRFEILDGRRRFLAWTLLADQGVIGPNHLVQVVVCETADEIAQAVIIANEMRKEVQHADVLLTLNRLLSEHYTFDDMAKTLGRDVKEIKKMAILGQLDARILQAFKENRLRLATLRQVARIKDPEKMAMLIEMIEDSEGVVQEYHIRELVEPGVYSTDVLLNAIPLAAYLKKGGRIEQDLFEEQPDKLLDPDKLTALWKTAMKPVIKALKDAGLHVEFNMEHGWRAPEGFAALNWNYPGSGDKSVVAALDAEGEAIKADLKAAGEAGEHARFVELSTAYASKALEAFTEKARPLLPKACKASLGGSGHVKVEFYVAQAEYETLLTEHEEKNPRPQSPYVSSYIKDTPLPKTNVRPDVSLYGHLHHLKTTTIAGRSLARSLAETPMVALDVQLSTQFQQVVLGRTHDSGKYVVKLCASVRLGDFREPNPTLDQPIIDRLKAYEAEYQESGLHPFEWVSGLAPSDKLDLLALITASQVDMAEPKTNMLRHAARAEAILISGTIGHDFKNHMAVDADYYANFSKKSLLAIVAQMGLDPDDYSQQKRGELAVTVHELALERDFVPPALNFHEDDYTVIGQPESDDEEDDDAVQDAATAEPEGEGAADEDISPSEQLQAAE